MPDPAMFQRLYNCAVREDHEIFGMCYRLWQLPGTDGGHLFPRQLSVISAVAKDLGEAYREFHTGMQSYLPPGRKQPPFRILCPICGQSDCSLVMQLPVIQVHFV